jgi:hypothetical protein
MAHTLSDLRVACQTILSSIANKKGALEQDAIPEFMPKQNLS